MDPHQSTVLLMQVTRFHSEGNTKLGRKHVCHVYNIQHLKLD